VCVIYTVRTLTLPSRSAVSKIVQVND